MAHFFVKNSSFGKFFKKQLFIKNSLRARNPKFIKKFHWKIHPRFIDIEIIIDLAFFIYFISNDYVTKKLTFHQKLYLKITVSYFLWSQNSYLLIISMSSSVTSLWRHCHSSPPRMVLGEKKHPLSLGMRFQDQKVHD